MLSFRMQIWRRSHRTALVLAILAGCSPELGDSRLPERTGTADTSALPHNFRSSGGPVLLRLTGWADSIVVRQLVDGGLRPLPGYGRVERLDSLGMNVVGGVVPPGGLDSILALRYVLVLEPAYGKGR